MGLFIGLTAIGSLGYFIQRSAHKQHEREQAQAQARAAANARTQALAAQKRAAQKKELVQSLDSVIQRLEARIDADATGYKTQSYRDARLSLRAIVSEISDLMILAKEESRTDIATALQSQIDRAQQSFQRARLSVLKQQQDRGLSLYDQEQFEPARAEFYDAVSQLEQMRDDIELPESGKKEAVTMLTEANANLDKAVRGKEFPDIVEYFNNWRANKKSIQEHIRNLDSKLAHQSVIIELAIPLTYLNYLDQTTPAEYRLIPKKYRSQSFTRGKRKELKALEAKANKELLYVVSCGEKPELITLEATRLMQNTAHDPDSIEVDACTSPRLTMRRCWQYTCNVRGRNLFGALVLNSVTFYQDATTIRSK